MEWGRHHLYGLGSSVIWGSPDYARRIKAADSGSLVALIWIFPCKFCCICVFLFTLISSFSHTGQTTSGFFSAFLLLDPQLYEGAKHRRLASKQESRAVARKPRDAAAVLFGLISSPTTFTLHSVFWNTVRNGPSRSSKVVDFGTNRKRVCDFLLAINNSIGPILPRFRDTVGFLRERPHPIPPDFLGVFPLDLIADVAAPRSEDPMLIIRFRDIVGFLRERPHPYSTRFLGVFPLD